MEETAALGEDQEGASAVGRGGAARRCRALYARAEVEEEECRSWGRVVLLIRGMRRRRAVEAIFGVANGTAIGEDGVYRGIRLAPSSTLGVGQRLF